MKPAAPLRAFLRWLVAGARHLLCSHQLLQQRLKAVRFGYHLQLQRRQRRYRNRQSTFCKPSSNSPLYDH